MKVHAKSLTPLEKAWCRAFYWSGFYGERAVCQFFLKKLGVSPFMKLFGHQNVIDSCVKGGQYEELEYLILNSKKGAWEHCGYRKYDTTQISSTDLDYYWKSRQNKDENGSDSCHVAFEIVDERQRYKFLSLLLSEEIGDLTKPNVMGNLPHEIEHRQPLGVRDEAVMPAIVQRHLAMSFQEQEEADYCIVTP